MDCKEKAVPPELHSVSISLSTRWRLGKRKVNLLDTSSSAYEGTVEIVSGRNKQKALKTIVFRALI